MKSSEVKGVRRLESRETVGSPVFSEAGAATVIESERHAEALGPSGRPRVEAAPEKARW